VNGAVARAWAVHCYTASGAVLGFLALDATARADYAIAFAWMAVATFIDSTDGTLARRVRVKDVLPHFDGARLDDIVDYLNYVVVPVVLAQHAGLLPPVAGLLIGACPARQGTGSASSTPRRRTTFSRVSVVLERRHLLLLRARDAAVVQRHVARALLGRRVRPIRYLYPSKNDGAANDLRLWGLWAASLVVLLWQFPPRHACSRRRLSPFRSTTWRFRSTCISRRAH